jgi:hypothetical protein
VVEFSKWLRSWKIVFETMTGSIVISEVDDLMYVVLSNADKHVSHW